MANVANNGSKWIRKERRQAIYMRDAFCCVYCSIDLTSVQSNERTLDHIIPQHLGGTNSSNNLVTACKSCNSSKGNKSTREFGALIHSEIEAVEAMLKRIANAKKRIVKVKR